jgi:hypothetical protein
MPDILGIWITIKKMTFPPRTTKNTGLNTGVDASIAAVCNIKMNQKRGLFLQVFMKLFILIQNYTTTKRTEPHFKHDFPNTMKDKTQTCTAQGKCLTMTYPHGKDEAQAQSAHKLDEMPLILPFGQDPHNLCHLLKQFLLIP